MYIYTKIILDMDGNVLEKEGYEYEGPVAECKGASQQEKDQAAAQADLAKRQSSFYDVMTSSYSKMFAGQTAILETLKKTFDPIIAAGPSHYGLSRAEDTAMRTMASEGTAQSYKMAKQAVAEQQGAQSGDAFIPKGADAQVRAQLASAAAGQEAQQQTGITKYGYDVGREQYWKAAESLGGVAKMYDPTGYAGESSKSGQVAGGTGESAFGMQRTIYDQNKAASPWNIVGGVLGGALNAFTGGAAGAIGSTVGGLLGGGSNLPGPRDPGPGAFMSLAPL
jgi:hypothetical protein